jgi:hypothetical protein
MQGKQLGYVVLIFNNKYFALLDWADVNGDVSSCRISRLADFLYLPESRPEISRNYHGGLRDGEKMQIF